MNRKQWLSKSILLSLMLSFATPTMAAMDASLLEMSEQMDGVDKQDFQAAIDKANTCTRARNFKCAESELAKAAKAANSGQDKKTLLVSRNGLANEKQQLAFEIRRAEEERQAQIRRDEEEKYAQRKRDEKREELLWLEKYAAHQEEGRKSTAAYKAQTYSNMQNDLSRSMAQAEAGSRGSSIEEDRAKARRLAEFNDNISQMEADPNSDLNRDKRAREREREKDSAAAQRADSERAAKRDAAKKVALANDAKRASDKSAKADTEENTRKKQKADELKAQQEREKKRLDAERRSQELRDTAERKRVAAAEEAKRKAEKEREAQAEKQARVQYLQSVTAGTRLVATKCLDGEGKYYATGTRPNIKPEVVGCVDVRFRAYCPGSRQYSEGLAHNFLGMAGCFGDTYDINPKPACKVDQVRIEVVEARECGK